MTALALSGDWAMFTKRDALHVRDIERAFAGSSAPFSARATSYALETSDIEGAAPRARTRGAAGGAPLSRSLTTADIAGARPRGPARPSERDPLEPNYALPSAQQARWGPAEFRGIYAMNGRGLDGGSAHARAQVREGNYTVDGPRALYPGAPRSTPERIDGARPFARAHAADARRAGPPRDALFAADILHPRLFQSARDAPGRSPAEHAGALSDAARALRWGVPRDPPRDPVDPEYNYDCAGPDAVGPISGARHIQPYTLERTILASGPRAGRPPPPRVEGSGADTRSALRRGRATRRGILEIDDIEGCAPGSCGQGFVLYRRPDYEALSGRARVAFNAPGEPAPPTKQTNKLDDIDGTNPGSALPLPAIYRPSQLDHLPRMAALLKSGGDRPDGLLPFPLRSAAAERAMEAHRARRREAVQEVEAVRALV